MPNLPHITVLRKKHRDELQLVLKFNYNEQLISLLKSVGKFKWSQTLKSWYILDTDAHIDLIKTTLHKKAKVDFSKLPLKRPFIRKLSQEQRHILNGFYKYLKGKRYSESTIHTYTTFVADFVGYRELKPLVERDNRDVELFIEQVFIERKYSISTQRQFISALKLFIVYYPHTQIEDLQLERPKKSKKLPSVLSQEEVIHLLRCTP